MIERLSQTSLLRNRASHHRPVTTLELFFDLVYVFAITQLSHLLLEHLTWHGVFQTGLLTFAIWWAWIYTAWFTNWFDPDAPPVRVVLIAIMLVSLIMSASIPEAFGDRGLIFAAAFALIALGRPAFAILASRRDDPALERNYQRIFFWSVLSAVFWIAGGLADAGTGREVLWLIAVAIDLAGPVFGFLTPRLGRSSTHDWSTISGGHIAERCQLFMIIAFGESILSTGRTFASVEIDRWVLMALVAAFIGSVVLWWIYFGRSAVDASNRIEASDDPGRLGRAAYTYTHLPMVAGIIVLAVGDELSVAHPTGDTPMPTALLMLGGPALFLAGHVLFKLAVWQRVYVPHLIAIAALLALIPFRTALSPVALAAISTAIVLVLNFWLSERTHREETVSALQS